MKTIRSIMHSFRILKEVHKASVWRMPLELVSVFTAVVNSIVARILLMKLILDKVVQGNFKEAIIFVILAACLDLVCSAFGDWMNVYYRKKDNIRLHRYFHEKLYQSAVEMDIRYYDNPEYYDEYILAARNSDATVVRYIATLNEFFVTIIQILISGGLIIANLDYLFWVVVVSATLYAFVTTKNAKTRVSMTIATNPYEKKREYIKRMFFLKKHSLDMRTTNVANLLFQGFDDCKDKSIETIKPFAKKRTLYYSINGFLFYSQYLAIIVLLTWRALTVGDISVGDFSMLLGSALILNNNWRFIGNTFSDLAEHDMFFDKYDRFIQTAENIKVNRSDAVAPEPFECLQAHNLIFGYESESNKVFSDLSLSIQRGQKIALVGPNGAGKTTFVNLVLNLYEPQKGTIRYNGKDIRQYDPTLYRDGYSLIFQDSRLYPITIAENLLLGPMETEEDEQLVWTALDRVGLEDKVRQMPLGLSTPVTKEFDNDGVVFSGGESQRIALARALLQDTLFFIMDEPTSSLDPKQELQLNRLFTDVLSDKTMILISHRLSTISGVDYIYLINEGIIEEEGTHLQLMEKNGHYARIYETQSKLYEMK